MQIISAKTVSPNNAKTDMCESVPHEVTYRLNENSKKSKKVIMARDPMDAIDKVRREEEWVKKATEDLMTRKTLNE
jgi:hypothetical protein|tara:strand:- start:706 stop:933 length:228 start_codon:yes stop_codon:yes gene_type:complete